MRGLKENIIRLWIYLSLFIFLAIVLRIFSFLFLNGISGISLEFLLENPKGIPLGELGGIRNAILGSFALMLLSVFFALILGVCTAIYNTVYCDIKAINIFIRLTVQCISSIPSIVLGLFVYGFFIVSLNLPSSLLTAAIALGLMVFPFIEIKTEKAIRDIDSQCIKDSAALGVGKSYMCRRLILPSIRNNIIADSILAGSYALGATAPILMTGAVYMAEAPKSIFKPIMALPFHLHMLLGQAVSEKKAYATALVLLFILIIFNILAEIIIRNIGGKAVEYIRGKVFKHSV